MSRVGADNSDLDKGCSADEEAQSSTSYSRLHRLGSSSTSNITSQAEEAHNIRAADTSLPFRSYSSSGPRDCKLPSTGLAKNATGDPTDGRLLLPIQFLEGRRVGRDGNVLDHNGDVLGKVVQGNVDHCAGAYIREEGKIVSASGKQLGLVRIVGGPAARDAFAEWRDTLSPLESAAVKYEDDEENETVPQQTHDQPPEATISTNAMQCVEMAKNSEPGTTSTFLSLQGEATQKIEFEKMERKMTSLVGQLQSIENDIHAHMHPKLYDRLPFREVTATYDKILAAIADQRTWRVFEDNSGVTGGQRPQMKLPEPKLSVVDDVEKVSDMIDGILAALDTSTPDRLVLFLQGKQSGRGGDISIMTIYVPSRDHAYILDVAVLGAASFGCSGTSTNASIDLRQILENPDVTKLMFDCRLPSIALHDVYGIKLDGVIDAQLAFCATRTKLKERRQLSVLSKAVLHSTAMDKEDQKTWKSDLKWGNVCLVLGEADAKCAKTACEKNSNKWQYVENFVAETKAESGLKECNARPIPELVSKYCIAQVILLGPLLDYCTSHPVWTEDLAKRVEKETTKRLGMREWKELPQGERSWNAAPVGWANFEHCRAE
ncbi:hypothetical protein AC578_3587 [Pseudocercospora eumusae]|uniref:3'-5' exonuclease domain-containing protein n=1 Tax=Pseudocercospora eumusae TaxID=321146 RepID=A0A139HPL3_9PEZI|nr:hypothetical protein AC578_3587 [Pseudocercospora eumusae]